MVGSSGSTRKLRIVCVISTMQVGGAEHVMRDLSDRLVGAGHETMLLTLDDPSAQPFYPLHSEVRQRSLGATPRGGGLKRVRRVWHWINSLRQNINELRPNVVVSFIDLTNVMVLLATYGLKVPVIADEQIDPHHYRIGRLGNMLRRLTYPHASRVAVLTTRAAGYFGWLNPSRLVVLPNRIARAGARAFPVVAGRNGRWRIIAVGRLDRQKGFDLLIPAFARLAARFSDWDVVIFGEGPEREALSRDIARYGLSGRFVLAGLSKTVGAELAASHVFVFPSRFEGFSLALGEAMAAALPSVTFRDVSGAEDLILDGVNGYVADRGATPEAAACSLSEKLALLMESPDLRGRLGEAATQRIQPYAPDQVYALWERLFIEVATEAAARA